MKHLAWFIGACFLVSFGCGIDDEDRCPDGFYWDSELKACLEKEEEQDAGCVVGEDVGFLESCESDADCAGFDAKDCIEDPRDPGAKICNIVDCVPADCVCEFKCCDCSALPKNPFEGAVCASPGSATTLSALNCTCE